MRLGLSLDLDQARARGYGDPRRYKYSYALKLWLRADIGVTLGSTLRATGTTPPAVTLSGTAVGQVAPHLEIDSVAGGTGLGQATYKWSANGGTSYVATGVLTAAGPTALGTTGYSVAFAAGPYNIDNKWDGTVSGWQDQSGLGNHGIEATPSRQVLFSTNGFGGLSCLDWGVVSNARRITVPNVGIGAHTVVAAVRGQTGAEYLYVHVTDAATNGSYSYCQLTNASYVSRSTVASAKRVAATWLSDNARRTLAISYGGTHATNRVYRGGVLDTMSDGPSTGDPGAAVVTGTLHIGSSQVPANGFRGQIREFAVYGAVLPQSIITELHAGMQKRSPGAL
jgi:hypothetical protein